MLASSATGTVLVIDDDELIAEVHAQLLRSAGFTVRCFHSASDFLAQYRQGACECILTDLQMPHINGLELHQRLIDQAIDTPVIFITGHADVPTAVAAMRCGAFDYVEKPVHGAQLIERVSAALALSRQHFAKRQRQQARAARLASLTPKELQIADWVAQGHTSRAIAELAGLSVRTVENHRARIMDKLGVHSVADMVRLLLAH